MNERGKRSLIVNADDFGLSELTNQGIIAAHERGIVTSASLMVRQPAAHHAAAYALQREELSIGLHIDLGEWVFREGAWEEAYRIVSLDEGAAVTAEINRQLSAFRQLMHREPTHLDSHQHVHRNEPAKSVVTGIAIELGLPVRDLTTHATYFGGFYGRGRDNTPFPEGITARNLIAILSELPPGVNELACHPGLDQALDSAYRDERLIEVQTLCDTSLEAVLRRLEIDLISFGDLSCP